jgi:hypothetical protein
MRISEQAVLQETERRIKKNRNRRHTRKRKHEHSMRDRCILNVLRFRKIESFLMNQNENDKKNANFCCRTDNEIRYSL